MSGKSYTVCSFMGDQTWNEIETTDGARWVPWIRKTVNSVANHTHRHDNLGLQGTRPGPGNVMLLLDINSRRWNGHPDPDDNHGSAGGNVTFCDGHAEWIAEPKYFFRLELSQDNGMSRYDELE